MNKNEKNSAWQEIIKLKDEWKFEGKICKVYFLNIKRVLKH